VSDRNPVGRPKGPQKKRVDMTLPIDDYLRLCRYGKNFAEAVRMLLDNAEKLELSAGEIKSS
jgi:hypothetical protein